MGITNVNIISLRLLQYMIEINDQEKMKKKMFVGCPGSIQHAITPLTPRRLTRTEESAGEQDGRMVGMNLILVEKQGVILTEGRRCPLFSPGWKIMGGTWARSSFSDL